MIRELLAALGESRGAMFAVGNPDAVAELPGPRRVTLDGGWITLERDGCECHVHLCLGNLAEARFVEEPGYPPGATAYSVHFFGEAGDRAGLMVYLPAEPYHAILARFGGQRRLALAPDAEGA
jgi:hypothetical protein